MSDTACDAYLKEHDARQLEELKTLLRIPSISSLPEHQEDMRQAAEWVADHLRTLGTQDVALLPTHGNPVVYGVWPAPDGAPTAILYGHYDVQPPDPLDLWETPPFEPTVRDGKIYARGAGDNKGQHLAQLFALEALLACDDVLPVNVKVLLEGEEEIGSPRMASYIRDHRDELAADLVITSDGPVHESGRSQILFGVRGVLSFELRARGANRDLHSGNWGGIAPNPLWTLIHLLATMKNDAGEVTIAGFYDRVLPLTELEREALARIPMDVEGTKQSLGLRELDAPRDRPLTERLAAWPTFTINGMHGGYGGPGSKTVLPHEASAKCDIRLVEGQTAEEIFAKVKAHVERHAPEVEVLWQGAMDPSKTPLDSPFAEPLRLGIAAAQGEEPLLVPSLGGSLPDYVFTKILGVPAFTVPYANADESNHAPNENIEIERFIAGIKTGAAMLAYLGALHPPQSPA